MLEDSSEELAEVREQDEHQRDADDRVDDAERLPGGRNGGDVTVTFKKREIEFLKEGQNLMDDNGNGLETE